MGLFAILIVFSRHSSAPIHSPRRRLERVGAASSRKNYLHMSYSISHISDLISARRIGNTHADIECLLTDSRSLVFPETTLFFALRTGTGDGHRYIDDLYRRGVHNFVVGTLPDDAQAHYPSANFLLVASPLQALQTLTEQHRLQFDIPVVGITGSNGKTIVKEWIYQLLSPSETVTRSPRSYNSQIGVPLSVWLLNEHSRVALFEAGISRPGEMSALRHIIRPTLGVLTNIGAAHEANFATPDEKCLEKLKLFKHTPALIYCVDNLLIDRCLDALNYTGQRIGWSRRSPQAAFYAEVVPAAGQPETIGETAVTHSGKTKIRLHDRDGQRIVPFEIPFDDEASIENAIHTAIVGLQLQLTPTQIGERMPHLDPVAMRLEVKQGVRGLTLIDDAYNSDLTSLDIALDFLARRKEPHHRSILVLSDFQQSGIAPDVLYHRVAALLAPRQVDMLIGVGSDVRQLDGLVKSETHFFDTTDALLESGLLDTLSHDVILLKGARAFAFEQLTDELLLKVHETTLEVNLGALADNLRFYRSFMRPETKITCMIKAGAYGCGSVEVARTLQDLGVDYLAVAVADEGVELRKAGITAGILIMNPEMSALHTLFKYRLEPEVYNFRLLDALIRAARREGITQYPYTSSSTRACVAWVSTPMSTCPNSSMCCAANKRCVRARCSRTLWAVTRRTSTSFPLDNSPSSIVPRANCKRRSLIIFFATFATRRASSASRNATSTCAASVWDSTALTRSTTARLRMSPPCAPQFSKFAMCPPVLRWVIAAVRSWIVPHASPPFPSVMPTGSTADSATATGIAWSTAAAHPMWAISVWMCA